MSRPVTFRDLVDEARTSGRAAHLRPRPISWAAKRCGVSVAHLYNLFNGAKIAPSWTVALIAKGLAVEVSVVQQALDRSRAETLAT